MTDFPYRLGLIHDHQPPAVPDLAFFATAPEPTPPAVVEPPKVAWPMADNDTLGDCTIAGATHVNQAGAAIVSEPWTYQGDAATSQEYFHLTGGADTGLMLPQVLTPWHTTGLWGQGKNGGYVSVNAKNTTAVKRTVWIFGNAYIALNLPAPAENQFNPNGSGVWELTNTPDDYEIVGGHCLTPDARVLTRSMEWVAVGDLLPGDQIIGFDENIAGQGQCRKFRVGTVEAAERLRLPCYELEFEDGTIVTSAYDHLWLAGGLSGGLKWQRTDRLRVLGEGGRASSVCKPFDTWETDHGFDAGYLAGAFDGEGWVDSNGDHHFRLGFTQRDNEMLEMVRRCLKELKVDFRECLHHASANSYANESLTTLNINKTREVARFLGMVRPQRLLANARPEGMGTMKGNHVRLVRKDFVGEREVVALQTDCRTYIAEGLGSHNCVVPVGYDAQGPIAVTWGSTVHITWQWWATYVVQVYAVVPPAFVEKGGDGRGYDLAAIDNYLKEAA